MRRILIASHGHLASGFKSAVELLSGEHPGLEALDCYVDGSDWTEELERWLDAIGPGDEAVVFTDVFGGSVCQRVAAARPEERGATHVTGANLGLVLETALTGERVDRAWLERCVEAAREGCVVVELPQAPKNGADDDFFD